MLTDIFSPILLLIIRILAYKMEVKSSRNFLSNILSFPKTPLSLRPLNERFFKHLQKQSYQSNLQLFESNKNYILFTFLLSIIISELYFLLLRHF